MDNKLNIKQAERKTLALSFADGLWDILFGGMLVLIGLSDTFQKAGWPVWMSYMPWLVYTVIGIAVFTLLKQRLVTPRSGMVKISLVRSKQRLTIFIVAIALQLITLVVFLLGSSGSLKSALSDTPVWLVDALFGLGVLVFFGVMAYATASNRFFLYGLFMGLALPLGVILREQGQAVTTHPQIAAGILIALIGGVVFVKFLQKYPLPAGEAQDGRI